MLLLNGLIQGADIEGVEITEKVPGLGIETLESSPVGFHERKVVKGGLSPVRQQLFLCIGQGQLSVFRHPGLPVQLPVEGIILHQQAAQLQLRPGIPG